MGYRFQFVTLAGFHSLNLSMFELAKGYARRGIGAYSEMQEREFAMQSEGFTAVRHQHEVGTSYFDAVAMAVSGGKSSTTAMSGSTEHAQFHNRRAAAELERKRSQGQKQTSNLIHD
jgi:isocitrate lyase